MKRLWSAVGPCALLLGAATTANAAPEVPSGAHPRLFMSADDIAAYADKASSSDSAAAGLVSDCEDTLEHPEWFTERGGADGNAWPGSAVACAFSYLVTKNAAHLTQAIKYWRAALEDDQTLGDGLGCVQGVDESWQDWAKNGGSPAPPVLITVTHDTGYPIRWYGPDIALTYDWLSTAPGVDAELLAQTRMCLGHWLDWYSAYGYHHDEAASNYNAGFVIALTLGAVAIGNDGGSDGHLFSRAVDDVFGKLLIGEGLAGMNGKLGEPAGPLVGGDWPEGWQYGPLSVLEYATATRALEHHGVALPEMDAWTNSLVLRAIYATVPAGDGQWPGGDFDSEDVYRAPTGYAAVLAGPSSDEVASFAAFEQGTGHGSFIYDAFAEIRDVSGADFREQTPAPPLWYLARGTRTLYVRTGWEPSAYYAVFESSPQNVSDHHHFSASNFAFTRGADHLIVDPSYYGCRSTLPTNAVTADAESVIGDYAPSQTPWSEAELPWARASDNSLYAARSDFARAFDFASNMSSIPYARRDWVLLPEGEIVTIDRVNTGSADRKMYVSFHANSGGTLKLDGSTATGTVGGSNLAIHALELSGGTASITQPPLENGNCYTGNCRDVRIPVDDYEAKVPGPFAVAIHVIDGLASGEDPADTGSLNDERFDPAPKRNEGVVGAAVYRGEKQSYVVASSAVDGDAGSTLTYAVPGASPARHVVFDAPEASDGTSDVKAAVDGERCVVTIVAGSGDGFKGHPLMFQLDTLDKNCKVTESTDVAPAEPAPGGGTSGAGNAGESSGGGPSGGAGKSGSGGSSGGMPSGGRSSGSGGAGGSEAKGGAAGTATSGMAGKSGQSGAPTAPDDSSSDSGCGCRVTSGRKHGGEGVLAFTLGVGLLLRRRRKPAHG